tara:strand:+ start:202 stop:711 length:510 start_codon:yes stop_codon:yes gene_type:complete
VSFEIEMIQKDNVLEVWPEIEHFADNLKKRSFGRYLTADIFNQVIELPYFLWVVREEGNTVGFFICGVNKYPRKTYLDLNTLSGVRLNEWANQALEVVEELGEKLGFDGMETSTAPGLEKRWREVGFEKEFVVMTKAFKQQEVEPLVDADEINFSLEPKDVLLKEAANG